MSGSEYCIGKFFHRGQHPRLRREVVDAVDVLIQHSLRPEQIPVVPRVHDPSGIRYRYPGDIPPVLLEKR